MENSAEQLHELGRGSKKVATDSFVNPGTPNAPLANMADRKTGAVPGAGSQMLRDHADPAKRTGTQK